MSENTLYKLLTELEKADEGLVEFDAEKHRDLLLQTESKIDSYQYIIQKYASREAEVQAEIDELMAIKKTLQRRRDALKAVLLWVLKEKGVDSFPGVKHVVRLMSRKRLSIVSEPTSSTFAQFPELVKREYIWDKKAFDKAYAKDPETLGAFAKEEKTEYVQFFLKRGIDD